MIITKNNAQNMLSAAVLLKILPVRGACNQFLEKKLVKLLPLEVDGIPTQLEEMKAR